MAESLPVLKIGNKVLRQLSRKLTDVRAKQSQELIGRMISTARQHDGLGLAAPQVGLPLRIFVMADAKHANVRASERNFEAVINPRIITKSQRTDVELESCLSIPGYAVEVTRCQAVRVEYTNAEGVLVENLLTGMQARIFQHEFDHLNGIMIVDHGEPVEAG